MSRGYRLPAGDTAEPYYIRWAPGRSVDGENWLTDPKDERGVLFEDRMYDPITIAQYGLYQYERALDGDDAARAAFFAQANYLRDAQRADGAYVYSTAHPAYGASPGWISGMAQGEAASVLLRAHKQSGDSGYLAAA